jgi:type IV pilus assembly protein PilE
MRVQKGFTLIEIMVVVGIVAILSAIAIPSYTDYIRRARITEATSTLSALRVKMEQYFQDNRDYLNACTQAPAVSVAMLPVPTTHFTFTCPVRLVDSYTLVATGIANTSVAGFTYQLSSAPLTGVVMSSTFPVASGWTNSTICWALKKDGSC